MPTVYPAGAAVMPPFQAGIEPSALAAFSAPSGVKSLPSRAACSDVILADTEQLNTSAIADEIRVSLFIVSARPLNRIFNIERDKVTVCNVIRCTLTAPENVV